VPDDINLAGKDDDKSWTNLAGGEDRFALGKAAGFTEPTHPLDLEGIELGKHLVAPSLYNGGCWHHDKPPPGI
jgi:hypothetical protein